MPLREAKTNLDELSSEEASLTFSSFTSDIAWELGNRLRDKLRDISDLPAVIDISLANNNHCLFHSVSRSGTLPDNDSWVERKRKTVLRFGKSTWYMGCKFAMDEEGFATKYALGSDAGKYAIHGGGWPIKVAGVEGIVAVVVVSGLKPDKDHQVIVETIESYLTRA